MALTPSVAETNPAPDFGSFTYDIGGGPVLVNVTGDMLYGADRVAPMAEIAARHLPDLFHQGRFVLARRWVWGGGGGGGGGGPAPGDTSTMFFKKIALDLTNLTGGKQLHFDLYDEVFRTQNCNPNDTACDPTLVVDIDAGINAPFSHDAQSGSSGGGGASGEVPEPGRSAAAASRRRA
ncbi:MAG: hypothetical protein IPM80_15185 [Proteobacteria bacterium]|nr:hypothetical protein [Pseudomonadota bacterium]